MVQFKSSVQYYKTIPDTILFFDKVMFLIASIYHLFKEKKIVIREEKSENIY